MHKSTFILTEKSNAAVYAISAWLSHVSTCEWN